MTKLTAAECRDLLNTQPSWNLGPFSLDVAVAALREVSYTQRAMDDVARDALRQIGAIEKE